MSVINAMLKSLDARGAPAPGASDLSGLMPASVTPRRAARGAWRMPALLLCGGLAIGFAAFADWPRMVGSDQPSASAAPAPLAAAVTPEPVATSPAAVAEAPTPSLAISFDVPPARKPRAETPPRQIAALAPAPVRAIPDPEPAPAPAPQAVAPAVPTAPAPPVAALPARIDKRPAASTPEQRALLLHRQATELAQAGQRRTALERAREALSIAPQLAATRLLAAVLEHETGANDRAVRLLREGLLTHPRDAAQGLLLARVLVAQGAQAEALAALDQHAVSGPDADGLRGGILAQQGDFPRSLAAYEDAARQQPGNPMWWFGLGVALESTGQAPRARQAYARARSIGLPSDDLAAYAEQRLRTPD